MKIQFTVRSLLIAMLLIALCLPLFQWMWHYHDPEDVVYQGKVIGRIEYWPLDPDGVWLVTWHEKRIFGTGDQLYGHCLKSRDEAREYLYEKFSRRSSP